VDRLLIPCLLSVDLEPGEDPSKVAVQVLDSYQDMLEHGGWTGRGDWINATGPVEVEPATPEEDSDD